MDFELTEEHKMLRKTIRDFATNKIKPIAQEIDKLDEFPWDCMREVAELGLLGMLTPPDFGGTGPDRMGFLIALEEIAVASAGLALALATSGAASYMILTLGNDEQKRRYLPALTTGKWLGAMASAEPSGGANYPFTLQSTAQLEDGSYVLNGVKFLTSNGGEADVYLVLAKTDPAKGPLGISGLIVERGMPGFSFGRKENKLGLRGNVTRELIFQDCRVPRANLLAENILAPLAREMALVAMPALGAIAVGLANAALGAAIEYVKQRTVAFGQTLACFDGVQCTIADMITLVEASRLLVSQAGSVSETQADLTPTLVAGIYPCEAALEVTNKALQIFGGYGYTTDFALERYFRDARGLMLVAQPMELRKLVMSRLTLDLPPMVPPSGAPSAAASKHDETYSITRDQVLLAKSR
jgi:butyryl-CoA dehydrogenase